MGHYQERLVFPAHDSFRHFQKQENKYCNRRYRTRNPDSVGEKQRKVTFSGKKCKHTFTKMIACSPFGHIYFVSRSYVGSKNDQSVFNMPDCKLSKVEIIDSILQFTQPLSTTKLTLSFCDCILFKLKWFRWNILTGHWVKLLVSENFIFEKWPLMLSWSEVFTSSPENELHNVWWMIIQYSIIYYWQCLRGSMNHPVHTPEITIMCTNRTNARKHR